MKIFTKVLLTLFLAIQVNVYSQIPNGNFENWADEFNPKDWITNNVPGGWTTIQRSSTAAMGSFAVRMQVADFGGNPIFPYLQSMNFPVSEAYGSLMGYYQFQPVNPTEVIYLQVWFWEEQNLSGLGFIDIGTPASVYTQFNVEISHFRNSVQPDSAWIFMGIVDTSENNPPVTGAVGLIDELTFGPSVGVTEISSSIPDNYSLTQNYPNPFNPSTKIHFSVPEQSFVELMVYDILGNEITTLVSDTYSAGEYSVDFIADNLPAGVYLARFSAGKYSNTIKMTLLK